MAHFNQTVDSIGTGIRFQFAADGDSYRIAEGVTVGSTDMWTIAGLHSNISIRIDGRVEGAAPLAIVLVGAGNEATIGKHGRVSTTATDPGGALLGIIGDAASITNHGRVVSETAIGLVVGGEASAIVNTGVVKGMSGVAIDFGSGSSFENSGKVRANSLDDENQDYTLHNGVISRSENSLIINHKQGDIAAISSEGAGIAIIEGANGSEVMNEGKISSELWYGVDFFNLGATSSASLENSGKISGGAGSFRGNETADFVVNTGRMKGDLIFDAGADTFIFSSGYRKDVIVDFVGGTDMIDVSGWKEIDDFGDLLSHAKDRSGDVWIVAGKDRLIIDNVSKADLQEADFQF